MPLVRLEESTKKKLPLVRKELIRYFPEFEGMKLSQDFLINRAIDYYLRDSPYRDQLKCEDKDK